ncbi:MAG: SprB repeat-containing protein, partial [Saprospiraceae bacterium]
MTQTVPDFAFRKHYLARLAGTFAAFLLLPTLIWAQLTVTTTPTHVKCFGGANGAATATASGGVGPYTFQWSNGLSGATITGLTAGAYGVTVTASNGQTASSVALINQPNQLGVTAFGQSQICDIVPDGTATAVPFGGVPPYTYLWSNGQTSPQITGLAAGTYTVTVTDANGCTAADDTEIFFWNEGLWIMVSVDLDDQISCFGANDGEVNAMVMSGTAPYTYSWSNGVVFTTTSNMHSITNLGPGTYSVTVTDANGCTHAQSATLTSPPEVQIAVSGTSAQCGNTGSATVTPSGGTPPYLVVWNNGSTNFTITALAPGTYTATVTDANLCQKSASVTV